jgi:hypothetical protein
MIQQIAQLLYEFFNWQYAGVILIIWLLMDVAWITQWRSLFSRMGMLISKPIITKKDPNPKVPSLLYPRGLLEDIAGTIDESASEDSNKSQEKSHQEKNNKTNKMRQWLEILQDKVFDIEHPLTPIGNIISFGALVFFVLAEGVLVANTMVLLGLADELWTVFSYFKLDTALIGGTVAISIVGFWYFIELLGEDSHNVSLGNTRGGRSKFLKATSLLAVFGGIFVALGLSFDRLIQLGYLESSNTSDIILSLIKYGITTVNNILGAILTFVPAMSGAMTLIFLFVGFVFLARKPLMFFIDLIWRIIFIVVDFSVWVAFTPIVLIFYQFPKTVQSFFEDKR